MQKKFRVEYERNSMNPASLRESTRNKTWIGCDEIDAASPKAAKSEFYKEYRKKSADYRLLDENGEQIAHN